MFSSWVKLKKKGNPQSQVILQFRVTLLFKSGKEMIFIQKCSSEDEYEQIFKEYCDLIKEAMIKNVICVFPPNLIFRGEDLSYFLAERY
jgi:hypothetical protein